MQLDNYIGVLDSPRKRDRSIVPHSVCGVLGATDLRASGDCGRGSGESFLAEGEKQIGGEVGYSHFYVYGFDTSEYTLLFYTPLGRPRRSMEDLTKSVRKLIISRETVRRNTSYSVVIPVCAVEYNVSIVKVFVFVIKVFLKIIINLYIYLYIFTE